MKPVHLPPSLIVVVSHNRKQSLKLVVAGPTAVPPLLAPGSVWQRTWYDTPLVSVIIFWSSVGQVAGKPEGEADAARVELTVEDAVVEETCRDLAEIIRLVPMSLSQDHLQYY